MRQEESLSEHCIDGEACLGSDDLRLPFGSRVCLLAGRSREHGTTNHKVCRNENFWCCAAGVQLRLS